AKLRDAALRHRFDLTHATATAGFAPASSDPRRNRGLHHRRGTLFRPSPVHSAPNGPAALGRTTTQTKQPQYASAVLPNRLQHGSATREMSLPQQSWHFLIGSLFCKPPKSNARKSGGLTGRFRGNDQRDVLHLLRRRRDAAAIVVTLADSKCDFATGIHIATDDHFLALAKTSHHVHPLARLAQRLTVLRCSSFYRDRSHIL